MRLLIVTVGSWGDVAPCIGLGVRLRTAGHTVALATHARFADAVRTQGLDFRPLPADPERLFGSADGQRLVRAASAPARLARTLRLGRVFLSRLGRGVLAAAQEGADVVLASALADPLCGPVTEALRLPRLGIYLQPVLPTGAFPPLALAGCRSLGPRGNRLAANALRSVTSHAFAPAVADLRRQLGLPGRPTGAAGRAPRSHTICHGFSPAVVPPPPDWPARARVCGYWWPVPPAGWRPDDRLTAFLSAGPAPVFVGLGSFVAADAARLSALITRALRKAGLRGIVQSGWTDLHVESEDVLTVSEVPHEWLFPRMAAVVHHGGAGTTAAGLRAGVPAVPVPGQLDAYFWAARLTALGSAPTHVPYRDLTASRLAEALRHAVDDPAYRIRSRGIADRLKAEDGAARVLTALHDVEA
ncbi:glycosyltransferase [Streptomyces sp. Tu 3180]|uniref:glycosyltransferase n=1 Tax=Streptomyces sp. Tu 3180 TaxID=2682611 RepID=UPI0013581E09|nr:glycosyltransferase [Streptomyces sp. Tu 3180]KAF3463434.1 glycosyltransferase family 1 protein [Streptomyces sp. Tu 3180]